MTSKDKTGDKLVASIRKSKTGAVARKTSQRPDADEKPTKSKVTAVRPKSKAAKSRDSGGAFSPGRRVWPD